MDNDQTRPHGSPDTDAPDAPAQPDIDSTGGRVPALGSPDGPTRSSTSIDGEGEDGGTTDGDPTHADAADRDSSGADRSGAPAGSRKRRRGSRGGRNRRRPSESDGAGDRDYEADDDADGESPVDSVESERTGSDLGRIAATNGEALPGSRPPAVPTKRSGRRPTSDTRPELPERIGEGRPSVEASESALVRRPQIGDTRPAPGGPPPPAPKGRGKAKTAAAPEARSSRGDDAENSTKKRRRRGSGSGAGGPVGHVTPAPAELDAEAYEQRRGKERNGRPIGRYLMCVQVRDNLTQVAVLEGRNLIEHYVSRPADDVGQIHGNIYVGKVQNVLPGMEAAFVDIGTPKNAVLYRGDVQYDAEDIVEKVSNLRIEQMLKARQLIVCQVTKNPIGAKGARLTGEVSLPGRFVVLIPNSNTYGISKRLPDDVRKRLRGILDRVKPGEHGLIVRTAAEHATEHELRADMTRLLDQWNAIDAKAKRTSAPAMLYREPELAVRVIREEFNSDYRGVIIDDQRLFEDVRDYVQAFNPELADRIELYDAAADGLPMYERHHIHEQLHKALDRKVWLPSGGSLIIEHTEALTVIDVNTGKNVGTSNLEETVFRNNLEAAEEVAKQLRLRDIGGIVVIDFIDMEIKDNRRKVVDAFRSALARDKTRTQVFDITELGLVEMTRKRIGEGLLVNFADQCPNCEGRGVLIDHALID